MERLVLIFVLIHCSICKYDFDINNLSKYDIGTLNLQQYPISNKFSKDHQYGEHKFIPGESANGFSIQTLDKTNLTYPSDTLPEGSSMMFHLYSNESGYVETMWESEESLHDFIETYPAHLGVHCIFLHNDTGDSAAKFMQSKINNAIAEAKWHNSRKKFFLEKMHYGISEISNLWLSDILNEWSCQGAGCGLNQVWLQSDCLQSKLLHAKRVDARYDWIFNHTWKPAASEVNLVSNDCDQSSYAKMKVNIVTSQTSTCTLLDKILFAQKSGAVGVLVQSDPGEPLQDLTCEGNKCSTVVSIPVASIHYLNEVNNCLKDKKHPVIASLHNIASPNYYFGIDFKGNLVEPGWFLYPSLRFLAWQAQYLVYSKNLNTTFHNESDVDVVPVFKNTIMHGKNGTGVATVNLTNLSHYESVYLDMSLSCPEQFDADCAPWDHTVSLSVCCEQNQYCGSEIGRWITPFRRRIGRWQTDITMLFPLLVGEYYNDNSTCNFTMKVDAWWAKPWLTTLNLRFKKILHKNDKVGIFGPTRVQPLFQGGTFDENYNKKYHPFTFQTVLNQTYEVFIYAIITGHGSDNNNCAEFCPTSHHFVVNNNHTYNRLFKKAGTPIGCANEVLKGVVPNEHGTWLYGRDGWCDGQNVNAWVINISSDIETDSQNNVTYHAFYDGKDPKPTENPGEIIMSSYLVYVGYDEN